MVSACSTCCCFWAMAVCSTCRFGHCTVACTEEVLEHEGQKSQCSIQRSTLARFVFVCSAQGPRATEVPENWLDYAEALLKKGQAVKDDCDACFCSMSSLGCPRLRFLNLPVLVCLLDLL
jgi:hypothetical protein